MPKKNHKTNVHSSGRKQEAKIKSLLRRTPRQDRSRSKRSRMSDAPAAFRPLHPSVATFSGGSPPTTRDTKRAHGLAGA
eukprot:582177-Prorocentrum_minimum.AAC.1